MKKYGPQEGITEDGQPAEVAMCRAHRYHTCGRCGATIDVGDDFLSVRIDGEGRERVCTECVVREGS